jgi:hypothetical protein
MLIYVVKFREEESTKRKSRKVRENWARGDLMADMEELQFSGKLVICVQLPKRYAGRLLRKRLENVRVRLFEGCSKE